MTSRSVDQIIDQFRLSLSQDNSELATFPEFGNLYAIYRSVALVVQEQDTKLDALNDSLFLNTATGPALDKKAAEFNIFRQDGIASAGSVIILSNVNRAIPKDTVLNDPNTTLQFRVVSRVNIINGRGVGVIEATEFTDEANLFAGTKLTSSLFPATQFIVGNQYDVISDSYRGNLVGGQEREDDEELRNRVYETLQTLSLSTVDAIRINALNINGVSKVSVRENTPALGFITVYINSSDRNVIKLVENRLNTIKPVGTALIIQTFENISVQVNLTVTTVNRTGFANLNAQITQEVRQYIDNITLNNSLTKEGIAGSVLGLPGVINVEVLSPSNAISISDVEILNLTDITITYN